jgi:hypothetical protein
MVAGNGNSLPLCRFALLFSPPIIGPRLSSQDARPHLASIGDQGKRLPTPPPGGGCALAMLAAWGAGSGKAEAMARPVPWLCLYAVGRIVVPRRGRSRSLRTGGSGTQPGPCLSVKKGRLLLAQLSSIDQGLASQHIPIPSPVAGKGTGLGL